MEKRYFICSANNKAKVEIIKSVLEKIKSNEFYFTPVVISGDACGTGVGINDGPEKLGEVSNLLFSSFKEDRSTCSVYAIDIQEAVTFGVSEKNPHLCCNASFYREDMSKISIVSELVELPEILQSKLVSRKNIYESINDSFEEKVSEDTDLYNYFTKLDRISWYKKTLLKLFEV
jgi:hypothetical protein